MKQKFINLYTLSRDTVVSRVKFTHSAYILRGDGPYIFTRPKVETTEIIRSQ